MGTATSVGSKNRVAEMLMNEAEAYANGEERPLGSFVIIMGAYGAMITGIAGFLDVTGHSLPERLAWQDLALIAVATHKLSRQLAKDPVTSPLRAAFTRYTGTSGEAEVAEEVRGRGMRKALGELVTCPFCLGQWVATVGVFGLLVAPRPTRAIASIFAVLAGADVLQFAYAKLQAD